MWADIERFDIDQLIAADPSEETARRRRSFALQEPELVSVDVHWHDYYELGYVLEGEALHVVNGVAQAVSPGSVFLLSPADFHAFEPVGGGPVRMLNAVIHPDLVERTLEGVLPVGPAGEADLPWAAAALPAAEDDVRRVRRETVVRGPGWDIAVESSLRVILVELARAAVRPEAARAGDGSGSGPPAHVRRALRFVERHFREPITLAEVAAVAHLSPHWFSEQFRRATGDTFQSHVRRRRLQFARALLESTELGVTEVSSAAGFSDPSYFGRAYRAQFGTSPTGRSRPAGSASKAERSGRVP